MDLIDRQALLKQIDIDSDGEPGYYGDTWKFIDTIKNLPSATDNNVGTKLSTNLAEVGTDCISREQAIKATWQDTGYTDPFNVMTAIRDRIQQLPPIQPKRGWWIEIINSRGVVVALRCSRCEKSPRHGVRSDFCPNCGAKMEVNNESN